MERDRGGELEVRRFRLALALNAVWARGVESVAWGGAGWPMRGAGGAGWRWEALGGAGWRWGAPGFPRPLKPRALPRTRNPPTTITPQALTVNPNLKP